MIRGMRKRLGVPGLNTTSTADISFMLLIFFLVTTSMDVDKGMVRQLPDPEPEKQQNVQTQGQQDAHATAPHGWRQVAGE